ncbi:NmrA family NAD(P)-binding protein [Agrococcus baldri]|uniref:NAD(P)-binding domain-containing protein n=1 Tax=Agrococcus baldri TaxID=153730 RepID=A0AA87UQL9_9MICO|nr:NAD(P)H-binding protein [Agrococcus baldri]GEK78690.1 hypothetical protein ABA31_00410 [Agrococcus baldri]
MFTIIGATGHVGGAAAANLLDGGAPVRVVLRRPASADDWAARGAQVAIADLADTAALTEALRGSSGAFVMLPTDPSGGDALHRGLAASIATAVGASGVPHVVLLSSIGADLPDGTGPVRWLHVLERALGETDAVVTAIRSWHFQEKVEEILPAVLGEGAFPVFGESADVPTPMIATVDIGAAVADELRSGAARSEIVDLDGPIHTEREVAGVLGGLLGRELTVVPIPQAGWVESMTGAGVPERLAGELAALYGAGERGLLQARGDRSRRCVTPIEVTLRRVLQKASAEVAGS